MYRNQLVLPRRYPVLNQIAQNDRKKCIESQWCPDDSGNLVTKRSQSRTEFVHATVEDDLIGPGHVRSRSRSGTREAHRRSGHGQRSSSKPLLSSSALLRPGLEIHLPQRGRYIVVEDIRHHTKKRSSTPEFVLVNKENGRAIPLHPLYQNPQQRQTAQPAYHHPRTAMATATAMATPTDPPVDYHDKNINRYHQRSNRQQKQQRHQPNQQERIRKARSMSDLSEDGHQPRRRRSPVHSLASSFESPRQSSVFPPIGRSCFLFFFFFLYLLH